MTNGPKPVVTSTKTRARVDVVLTADQALIDARLGANRIDYLLHRRRNPAPLRSPERILNDACEGLWRAGIDPKRVQAYRGTGVPAGTVALLTAARITPDEATLMGSIDDDSVLALLALRRKPAP